MTAATAMITGANAARSGGVMTSWITPPLPMGDQIDLRSRHQVGVRRQPFGPQSKPGVWHSCNEHRRLFNPQSRIKDVGRIGLQRESIGNSEAEKYNEAINGHG